VRSKLIAANWKMNGSFSLVSEMIKTIRETIALEKIQTQIVICPPMTLLNSLKEAVQGTPIVTGAQNVYTEMSGAYTGEISVPLIKECGVRYCIIGHSERRAYFNETDAFIHQKATILLKQGIRPILCVGESLEQREKELQEATVIQQLKADLHEFSPEQLAQCVMAYEPIWAIGTGKTATPEQANQMHQVIRQQVETLASKEVADSIRILYGGSVNAGNAEELLGQPEIDGALVGGASLKPTDFCQIIQASDSVLN